MQNRFASVMLATIALVAMTLPTISGQAFNGVAENQRDDLDYYYVMTGGKFPNGQTLTGTPQAQSTMAFVTDDPAWGRAAEGVWEKDGWFAETAGLALTLWHDDNILFDNNGIEDGTYGDFYTEGGNSAGLYRGYSNSNNYDWIYAGYFKITESTTITAITGYFDATGYYNNGSFDPNNFDYRMNIWSMGDNYFPVNTGGFTGDVFSSDLFAGSFAWSGTGVVRDFTSSPDDPISRMTYTLAQQLTLQPGEYWFSHDAVIPTETVPEPATMTLLATGLAGMAAARRKRSNLKG